MMEHLTEFHGRYPVTLKPTAEAKTAMKAAMASHFRETAFGARCQVEDFANDEKFALFIFHEDEVAPFDRFNDKGVVEPDWQRPVVRLAAVFQFETSTLLVKAPRVAEREKLRDLFARALRRRRRATSRTRTRARSSASIRCATTTSTSPCAASTRSRTCPSCASWPSPRAAT
jgi:hypothetical protein